MRVLIFHGYLLRGTGSNVYNASLAPALAALGHDVHLLCQDRERRRARLGRRVGEWTAASCGRGDRHRAPRLRRLGHRLRARYRRPAARLRRRRVRGLRGKDVPRAERGRARRATSRPTSPPCGRSPSGPAASTPRSPTTWSWGRLILAPRRAALRGEGPRLRARVHGQARPGALPALRDARAIGAAQRRARRLAPHGREPLGGDGRAGCSRRRRGSARPASTPSCSADRPRRERAAPSSRPSPRRSTSGAEPDGPAPGAAIRALAGRRDPSLGRRRGRSA